MIGRLINQMVIRMVMISSLIMIGMISGVVTIIRRGICRIGRTGPLCVRGTLGDMVEQTQSLMVDPTLTDRVDQTERDSVYCTHTLHRIRESGILMIGEWWGRVNGRPTKEGYTS